MFGGSKGNTLPPDFVDESQFQYQTDASNQLQLFGNLSGGCSVDPVNYFANENLSPAVRPYKRGRETEKNIPRQQNLRISLNHNYNIIQEVDRSANIPKQNLVSTGLRLSYDDDERNSSVTSASGGMVAAPLITQSLGDNIRLELDRQGDKLQRYINIQAEQMAKGVTDMKQRHIASFLTAVEKGVSKKLQEKDIEIENMNRKNKELVERIKQVATEAQNWQYRAKYNESVVNVLKTNLQQAISQNNAVADHGKEGFGDSEIDDAASHMDLAGGCAEGNPKERMMCRACKAKEVSVLLVPCRHLCLCRDCNVFIRVCPVCRLTKTSSLQVFFS